MAYTPSEYAGAALVGAALGAASGTLTQSLTPASDKAKRRLRAQSEGAGSIFLSKHPTLTSSVGYATALPAAMHASQYGGLHGLSIALAPAVALMTGTYIANQLGPAPKENAKKKIAALIKEGSLPLEQIAKALVNLGLLVADHANEEHAVEHAAEQEEQERELESEKMAPMLSHLHDKAKSAEVAAIQSGRLLAKTAMGVPWAAMGSAAKGAMGAVGSAAKAITPGWKTKALLGAGVLATGAGAYKGMQAVRNEMSTPVHSTQQWGTNRPVMNNVSEYGYPTL